jgi:hypothetical protein
LYPTPYPRESSGTTNTNAMLLTKSMVLWEQASYSYYYLLGYNPKEYTKESNIILFET